MNTTTNEWHGDQISPWRHRALRAEAEIARLQDEVGDLVRQTDRAYAECASLEAEVARLREALAFYANPCQWDDFVVNPWFERVDVGAPRVLSVPAGWLRAGYDVAHAALAGTVAPPTEADPA